MSVAAEHRFQKLERKRFDEKKMSYILALEAEVSGLKQDVIDLFAEIKQLKEQLRQKDAELIKQQPTIDNALADVEKERIAKEKWIDLHRVVCKQLLLEERGHKKASAVLLCVPTQVREDAKIDAKIYYPQLWESKDA